MSTGEYLFNWKAVAASGLIEGEYEQTISAINLHHAAMIFASFHGNLNPDENGVCLVITNIAWSPA